MIIQNYIYILLYRYLYIKHYFNNKIDVILSDMAINTTGNKSLDSYRTGELCINAMNLATNTLGKDGVFLSKIFNLW